MKAATRSATRSTSGTRVEPDHHTATAETRFQREIHLGQCRRDGSTSEPAITWRLDTGGGPLALLKLWVHGIGESRELRRGNRRLTRQQREDLAAEVRDAAGDGIRVEDSEVEQHSGAGPRTDVLPGVRRGGRGSNSPSASLREVLAGRTDTRSTFKVPEEAIGCGFHEAVRGAVTSRCHPQRQDRELSPVPADPVERQSARFVRHADTSYEDGGDEHPAVRGERQGTTSCKGIDIMRTVRSFDPCLPCGVHMYLGDGKELQLRHAPMFGVQGPVGGAS